MQFDWVIDVFMTVMGFFIGQYSNSVAEAQESSILHDFEVNVCKDFFGSEHGKGEADGETGVITRAVDRAVDLVGNGL